MHVSTIQAIQAKEGPCGHILAVQILIKTELLKNQKRAIKELRDEVEIEKFRKLLKSVEIKKLIKDNDKSKENQEKNDDEEDTDDNRKPKDADDDEEENDDND